MSIVSEIIRCTNFAAKKHSCQRRKDVEQTPYINHPVGVAYILTSEGGIDDLAVIQTALLHDTVEDTETSFDEIRDQFGSEVADLVREVTDDKFLPKEERKRLQVVHAATTSYKARLVKLADKLYNIRDLKRTAPVGWESGRVLEYYEWTRKVLEGLRGTNEKLERLVDTVLDSVITN